MSWLQISFVVSAEQVEPLSDLLEMFLAQAVTTENAGADEYYEVAFPGTPDWHKVAVTGLFDGTVDPQPIVDFVLQRLTQSALTQSSNEIPITVNKLEDQEWERVWLKNFKPIKVGERLWVCPNWCQPVAPGERTIMLDPGLAFGTGTHPTTALCLAWLAKQDLSSQAVLDYGSGSGILAIAALLCGAEHADAVDIDPLAVAAASENAVRNNIGSQFNSYLPQELGSVKYSLVIANILAEVIIELRDTLLLHLAPSGTLLLTGILHTQVDRVTRAYGPDFEFQIEQHEQWSMLTGRRNSN